MKIKSKIYAKALFDLISDGKSKNITEKFLALLIKNRDIKRAKEIVLLAENELLKQTGNKKITLETARKVDTKNIVKDFYKKGDVIEEKIKPDLIAGIKIIIDNNKQLDFSLHKKLSEIFK